MTAAQREQSKKLKEEVIQKHQTRFKRQAEIVKEIDDASYQEEDLEELVQLERRITESELADEDTIQEDGEEALQNNGGLVSDDEEEDDLGFNLDTAPACGMVRPPSGASGNTPTREWQTGQEAKEEKSGDVFRAERTARYLFLATEGMETSQILSLFKNMSA